MNAASILVCIKRSAKAASDLRQRQRFLLGDMEKTHVDGSDP
ncbi:hypothetical protein PAMC26577_35490 [Caballeronia sordidicola]|uniref:Uncharacterized protein n=1 Tax=Caballeronia sordidicola TaxID=196367 RepID=A0A242M9R3_CABSO|nr:hypothetical protein PAMC26577_35490 [Caballeronia sordidicola]